MDTDKKQRARLRSLVDSIARSVTLASSRSRPGTHEAPETSAWNLGIDEQPNRGMLVFVALALAAHAAVFLVTLPSAPAAVRAPERTRCPLVIKPYRIPPPPPKKRKPIRRKAVNRLPIPDPTPRKLEPVIDPSYPEPTLPDDLAYEDLQIGIPEPPPGPRFYIEGAEGVIEPRLIAETKVKPVYPTTARRAKLQGKVVLQGIVRHDGILDELEILRVSEPDLGFSQAAHDAVQNWRYLPGTVDGQPVDVMIAIVVTFSLR